MVPLVAWRDSPEGGVLEEEEGNVDTHLLAQLDEVAWQTDD